MKFIRGQRTTSGLLESQTQVHTMGSDHCILCL